MASEESLTRTSFSASLLSLPLPSPHLPPTRSIARHLWSSFMECLHRWRLTRKERVLITTRNWKIPLTLVARQHDALCGPYPPGNLRSRSSGDRACSVPPANWRDPGRHLPRRRFAHATSGSESGIDDSHARDESRSGSRDGSDSGSGSGSGMDHHDGNDDRDARDSGSGSGSGPGSGTGSGWGSGVGGGVGGWGAVGGRGSGVGVGGVGGRGTLPSQAARKSGSSQDDWVQQDLEEDDSVVISSINPRVGPDRCPA